MPEAGCGLVGDSILLPFDGIQMAREEQQPREKKDNRIYLQEISVEQQIWRSTESIPRVIGNFEKCSSVDQNAGNFRRTRSFSLPRVFKKEKDTPGLVSIVFGAKAQLKKNKPKCDSLLTKSGQDNELNQNANCDKIIRKQKSTKTNYSPVRQYDFVIPKICIQTPEQVNEELYFTRPITIRLHQESTQDLTHDQPDSKECVENRQQPATELCEALNQNKSENKIVARRKRSLSCSDVYNSEALKISAAEVIKGSSSCCAFLDSVAARETDLCSTDL